jgi:hypothetical protein
MEMLFSIKTGSFPLYHPSYALGNTSMALACSQIFHLISYLTSIMPGYWNGKAIQWYIFFKLFSLGITHLALFVLVRKLRLNIFFSFLISFVTVYNMRMLDLFRFGAALEAYTGFLLLCALIGWYFLGPNRYVLPLGIIITTYFLVVSGHAQMMFYGLLGAGLFLLISPFIFSNILEKEIRFIDVFNFWMKTAFFILIGIILSADYILPFYFDFYTTNVGRVGQSYEWSIADIGLFEFFNNFFLPFHSDVHGAFGGSSLYLLVLLFPFLRFFKIRISRSIWLLWGLIFIVFLYILGDRTFVYKLMWKYVPFVSSFRHQGRCSMILPVLFLLLFVWLFNNSTYKSFSIKNITFTMHPYKILLIIALFITPLYIFLYLRIKPYVGEFPAVSINEISKWSIIFEIFAGWLLLLFLMFYSTQWKFNQILKVFILLMMIVQISIVMRYGTFVSEVEKTPTFTELKNLREKTLRWWSYEFINMHNSAVISQIKNSFIEPFIGRIFTHVISVQSQDEAYLKMRQSRLPQQVFIEDYDRQRAEHITENSKDMKWGEVELIYSSFNRLKFRLYSEKPAIFGLSYPYTGHWKAWVNGKRVHIYRANGSAHAVEIPAGESIIEFRYWSDAFFRGMLITCMVFTLTGIIFSVKALKGLKRAIVIAGILIIGTGIFTVWYKSLYSGDNFNTRYKWKYEPPLQKVNIAYGKKTSGVYLPSSAMLRYHSSRAVDGDKRAGSGVTIKPGRDDFLMVDLYKTEEIGEIILYGKFNDIPKLLLSQEGEKWTDVTSLLKRSSTRKYGIIFNTPLSARYIKIEPVKSKIEIDEVEVYRN